MENHIFEEFQGAYMSGWPEPWDFVEACKGVVSRNCTSKYGTEAFDRETRGFAEFATRSEAGSFVQGTIFGPYARRVHFERAFGKRWTSGLVR